MRTPKLLRRPLHPHRGLAYFPASDCSACVPMRRYNLALTTTSQRRPTAGCGALLAPIVHQGTAKRVGCYCAGKRQTSAHRGYYLPVCAKNNFTKPADENNHFHRCSRRVVQLASPKAALHTMKPTSITTLTRLNGNPSARSSPNIKNISAAITVPLMHSALGIEVSPRSARQLDGFPCLRL